MSDQPGGATPWVAILLLIVAIALLIATLATPAAHTGRHYTIVALYVLTSVADLLKERMRFGRGDAVALFGATLTAAATLATLFPITPLSIASAAICLIMLAIVATNIRGRLDRR